MNYEHDIKTLLTIGENIVIEFKRAGNGPEHDTYESICAFLNRQGGDVLLGVTDDGKVIGVPPKAASSMVRQIVNVMNDPEKGLVRATGMAIKSNPANEVINNPVNDVIQEAIKKEPGINKPRLAGLTGKSKATVERAIASLIAEGKIEHRGSKKTGGYFTTEERK